MKTAHKYNLKVIWSKRSPWDIDVLAISAQAVTAWLDHQETEKDHITFVAITLIQRDFKDVDDNFYARGL